MSKQQRKPRLRLNTFKKYKNPQPEILSKIQVGDIYLDPDDYKVSCISIYDDQLPEEVLMFIRMYPPSYMDMSEPLEENMYSDADIEEMLESNLAPRKHLEWIQELMDRNECAYFRLIKTKWHGRSEEQDTGAVRPVHG